MASWIALGLLAALAAARLAAGYPRPPRAYRRLWRHEAAFLAAAADALFPPGGAIEPSGVEAGIPDYMDRYLDALPWRTRTLIRLLILLLEHATLVFPGPRLDGFRRFSSLGPAQQTAVLAGWRQSRFFARRLVSRSLRSVLTLGYLASPPVLRRLELAPLAIATPVLEADLLYPPAGKTRAAIRYGPEDLTPPSDGTPLDPRGPLDPAYAEEPR